MTQGPSTPETAALATLRTRGVTEPIAMAFVLGTGLGSITDELKDPICVDYADLPGFPEANVSGHAGRLWIGAWEGTRVAIMEGRAHYYETGNPRAMEASLSTLRALGATTLVLTNSAGSCNLDWHPGSIALIADHINFSGLNPLIGDLSDKRFVNLREAYDRRLRARFRQAAAHAGKSTLHEGVYMWFSGPSFETPSEVKMAKLLGADLVGMSTVPEVILARRLDFRVLALSLVTNFATGIKTGDPSHAETKSVATTGAIALKRLLRAFVKEGPVAYA
ncbi:purine-nucleoside phosphorylase [Lichenihabitans sp. Uapishka_5]|uniref:purine-nucleoside phosphorylase n=1 Tax=Lichenihabitans sp. Uapishka_5 TaxID=3037302 RepID=UPI0029E7FDC2|nr:purine-nucleoside phosphorylase [Lichenihabitans sp. Uapishka_5]MDX7953094.1 purine-nucleoside phosphorylase [Lichenihabitans sp. Uapishka_5]